MAEKNNMASATSVDGGGIVSNDVNRQVPSWLRVTPVSGVGDGEISIEADPNPDFNVRSALVTITPQGGTPATVAIEQDGVDANDYVLKAGDTMTGPLAIDTDADVAPLNVTSSKECLNLNAHMLGGKTAAELLPPEYIQTNGMCGTYQGSSSPNRFLDTQDTGRIGIGDWSAVPINTPFMITVTLAVKFENGSRFNYNGTLQNTRAGNSIYTDSVDILGMTSSNEIVPINISIDDEEGNDDMRMEVTNASKTTAITVERVRITVIFPIHA